MPNLTGLHLRRSSISFCLCLFVCLSLSLSASPSLSLSVCLSFSVRLCLSLCLWSLSLTLSVFLYFYLSPRLNRVKHHHLVTRVKQWCRPLAILWRSDTLTRWGETVVCLTQPSLSICLTHLAAQTRRLSDSSANHLEDVTSHTHRVI